MNEQTEKRSVRNLEIRAKNTRGKMRESRGDSRRAERQVEVAYHENYFRERALKKEETRRRKKIKGEDELFEFWNS